MHNGPEPHPEPATGPTLTVAEAEAARDHAAGALEAEIAKLAGAREQLGRTARKLEQLADTLASAATDKIRHAYAAAFADHEQQAGIVGALSRRVAGAEERLAAAEDAVRAATAEAWEVQRRRLKAELLAKAEAFDAALAEAGRHYAELGECAAAYDQHVKERRHPWWGAGTNEVELNRVALPVLGKHFAAVLRLEKAHAARAPTMAAEVGRLSEAYEPEPEPAPTPEAEASGREPSAPVIDRSDPSAPPDPAWVAHMGRATWEAERRAERAARRELA